VVGGLLAALVTPRVTRRLGTQRWIVIVFAVAAVVEIAFGTPYRHWAFLVAAFFLGFAAQASKICVDTLVQEATDDDFRGRVFSFYDTLFNVSFVSAAVASAVLLPPDGKSYAVIAIVAGGYAVTSAVYAITTRRRMAYEPPEPVVV
jgi:MFS family permease